MGSGLAMSAYEVAQEKDLGNVATRLLVWLAVNVDDERKPPVYYGGAEHRATGLRPGTSDRAIRAAMAELKAAGVILQLTAAHPGRTAEYQLMFEPKEWRKKNRPHSSEMAEEKPSNGGRKTVAMAEPQLPPYPKESQRSQGGPTLLSGEGENTVCAKHPDGDADGPCWGCKKAREARAASEPKKVEFDPVEQFCAKGNHKWLADGTCNYCPEKRYPAQEFRDGFLFRYGKPVVGGPYGMTPEQYNEWADEFMKEAS